jgi:hypothetical protein
MVRPEGLTNRKNRQKSLLISAAPKSEAML